MLNETQKFLLVSLIAKDGNSIETILDNVTFDRGTKIVYLTRAITQDYQTFHTYLDKLYDPKLVDQEKEKNIDFIRQLKLINDLCFNNKVKYRSKITPALTHYFAALGPVDPKAFKQLIQEIINERIAELSKSNSDVETQKQQREAVEKNSVSQTGWRKQLDLPENQLGQSFLRPYIKTILKIIIPLIILSVVVLPIIIFPASPIAIIPMGIAGIIAVVFRCITLIRFTVDDIERINTIEQINVPYRQLPVEVNLSQTRVNANRISGNSADSARIQPIPHTSAENRASFFQLPTPESPESSLARNNSKKML